MQPPCRGGAPITGCPGKPCSAGYVFAIPALCYLCRRLVDSLNCSCPAADLNFPCFCVSFLCSCAGLSLFLCVRTPCLPLESRNILLFLRGWPLWSGCSSCHVCPAYVPPAFVSTGPCPVCLRFELTSQQLRAQPPSTSGAGWLLRCVPNGGKGGIHSINSHWIGAAPQEE